MKPSYQKQIQEAHDNGEMFQIVFGDNASIQNEATKFRGGDKTKCVALNRGECTMVIFPGRIEQVDRAIKEMVAVVKGSK